VEIQEVMRGIRRLSTRGVVKKEAAVDEQIKKMVDSCDCATYQGQRDRALLLLGFVGALRRSELVALDVAHLKLSDEGFVVTIAKSMPFSHIMAGSYNFNNALRVGATINLDEGKPIPHLFPVTVANLKEISPTYFVTAPLGFSMLADALAQGAQLRKTFFRNLSYMVFGGAVLPQSVHGRMMEMARAETGRPIRLIANYGSTETGPATSA
jgi:acyl-coenzyme A synthetase/AMP-(fatty) acid ligase